MTDAGSRGPEARGMGRAAAGRSLARRLNDLPVPRARRALGRCCASERWVEGVLRRRPFADDAEVLEAAGEVWWALGREDWLQAFDAHPRIGEREPEPRRRQAPGGGGEDATSPTGSAASRDEGAASRDEGAASRDEGPASPGGDATSRAWSREEQSGMAEAEADVRRAIREGNRAYEERFGHVFLIRAAGRSAPEMLAELRRRLENGPEVELREAAREQLAITRLRLRKLVEDEGAGKTGGRASPAEETESRRASRRGTEGTG